MGIRRNARAEITHIVDCNDSVTRHNLDEDIARHQRQNTSDFDDSLSFHNPSGQECSKFGKGSLPQFWNYSHFAYPERYHTIACFCNSVVQLRLKRFGNVLAWAMAGRIWLWTRILWGFGLR